MSDQPTTDSQNVGHGHVFPRPDGVKARCGGPAICPQCAREQARKKAAVQTTDSRDTRAALLEIADYLSTDEFVSGSTRDEWLAVLATFAAAPAEQPCPAQRGEDPRGCWRVRCQLAQTCAKCAELQAKSDRVISELHKAKMEGHQDAALAEQPQAEPVVHDGVWEALQRMIEDGLARGPGSAEDARLVAKYRRRLFAQPQAEPVAFVMLGCDGKPVVPTLMFGPAGPAPLWDEHYPAQAPIRLVPVYTQPQAGDGALTEEQIDAGVQVLMPHLTGIQPGDVVRAWRAILAAHPSEPTAP